MVEAAALALELQADKFSVELNDYRLFKGVIFDGTEPDALLIDIKGNASTELSVSVKVSSLKADGKLQFHYGCDVTFSEKVAVASQSVVPVSIKTVTTDKSCYSNGTLFHSDSLQGIETFNVESDSAWFRCRLPESITDKASGFNLTQASSNVFANDLVYQAMLVWVREELALGSLPSTTKSWVFLDAPSLHEAFYIELKNIKVQGNSIKADAVMLDENNAVLATLIECEVTASESLNETFKHSNSVEQS